jgi:hypothetical protein
VYSGAPPTAMYTCPTVSTWQINVIQKLHPKYWVTVSVQKINVWQSTLKNITSIRRFIYDYNMAPRHRWRTEIKDYSEHNNKVCGSQNEAPNFLTTERLLVSQDLCFCCTYARQMQLDKRTEILRIWNETERVGVIYSMYVCGDGNEQKLLVGTTEDYPCP